MSKKFYVVWKGKKTGIFMSWSECKSAVENFPGAAYKGFTSKEEAEQAFHKGITTATFKRKEVKETFSLARIGKPITESWCVDAACSGNPGKMEYRGVDVQTGTQLFLCGPYEDGTNNIGEFLALVHALALLKKNHSDLPIYSDSRVALLWVKNRKAKSKLEPTSKNAVLFSLIERAEKWLQTNDWKNPLLKWETKVWGEIPADFGRK